MSKFHAAGWVSGCDGCSKSELRRNNFELMLSRVSWALARISRLKRAVFINPRACVADVLCVFDSKPGSMKRSRYDDWTCGPATKSQVLWHYPKTCGMKSPDWCIVQNTSSSWPIVTICPPLTISPRSRQITLPTDSGDVGVPGFTISNFYIGKVLGKDTTPESRAGFAENLKIILTQFSHLRSS